jgi:DNA recombination protein RmuC
MLSILLEADRDILALASSKRVALATPPNLMLMLTSVARLWQLHTNDENLKETRVVCEELYERFSVFANTHYAKLGRQLNVLVETYGKGVGSYNTRIMPSAQRLHDLRSLAMPEKPLVPLTEVETKLRLMPVQDQGDYKDGQYPFVPDNDMF